MDIAGIRDLLVTAEDRIGSVMSKAAARGKPNETDKVLISVIGDLRLIGAQLEAPPPTRFFSAKIIERMSFKLGRPPSHAELAFLADLGGHLPPGV